MENMITGTRIPKELAVYIKTPTGLVRTWHALGLYDWFITANKTELRGMISSLSREDRARIVTLHIVYNILRAEEARLAREHAIAGTGTQNNIARSKRRRLNRWAEYIMVLLVKVFMLAFLVVYFTSIANRFMNNSMPPPAVTGLATILPSLVSRVGWSKAGWSARLVSFELKKIYNKIDRMNIMNIERNIRGIEKNMVNHNHPVTGETALMLKKIELKIMLSDLRRYGRKQGNYTEINGLSTPGAKELVDLLNSHFQRINNKP